VFLRLICFCLISSNSSSELYFPCDVQQYASSWVQCMTTLLPSSAGLVLNAPFVLWDPSSLVVSRSMLSTYSYPATPLLLSFRGCDGPGVDADSKGVVVMTRNCPTAGNVLITISGINLIPPLQVMVGSFAVDQSSIGPLFHSNISNSSSSSFTCVLPPGTGSILTVQVCLNAVFIFVICSY
jgi:hypothetical protein